jgi:tripartite-type tricarboxylate transporter receptor subunit TctC
MLILALALAAIGGVATAQDDFPSKSVHIYVPFPPGGAVDIVGRTLGDELSKRWGQTVVIENRPGAGGTIATQALAKAPADGYTLIIIATGHAINPHLYDKLPYDTFADFTPISLIGSSTNLFLVKADSPIKTFADLLATARSQPGKLSFGHAGNGTSSHLAGELVKYMAKVDIGSGTQRSHRRAYSAFGQQCAGGEGATRRRCRTRARRDDRDALAGAAERAHRSGGRVAGL